MASKTVLLASGSKPSSPKAARAFGASPTFLGDWSSGRRRVRSGPWLVEIPLPI